MGDEKYKSSTVIDKIVDRAGFSHICGLKPFNGTFPKHILL
jgi:hypothetical protein